MENDNTSERQAEAPVETGQPVGTGWSIKKRVISRGYFGVVDMF